MNSLRRGWIKNRMLCGLVGSFTLLLLLSFVISLFFCRQAAENFERERQALILNIVRAEAESLSAFMSRIQTDTEVLDSAPGLAAFSRDAETPDVLRSFLETYVRSRYAFDAAAYYHVKGQVLCGFSGRHVLCSGPEAPWKELRLSESAFKRLLDDRGFALSGEGDEKRLIVCHRVNNGIVCFRVLSAGILSPLLHLVSYDKPVFDGHALSLSVEDRLGQKLYLGRTYTDIPVSTAVFTAGGTGIQFNVVIPDFTNEIIWNYVKNTGFYYGVALLICGSMLIYILSERIYKPVKNALEALPGSAQASQENSELDRIRSALLQLTGRRAADEELLRVQNLTLRRSFLQRIVLNGISDPSEAETLLEHYSLSSAFERFSIFYLLKAGEPISAGIRQDELDIPARIHGIYLLCISRSSDGVILLASAYDESDGFQAAADELLQELGDADRALCLIRSGVHCHVSNAHTAYLEVSVAAEELVGAAAEPGAYYYLELQGWKPEHANSASLNSLERQISEAMTAGDADAAESLFLQYRVCLSGSEFSFKLQRVQIAAMLSDLLTHQAATRRLPFFTAEAELLALASPNLSCEDFESRLRALLHKIFSPDQEQSTLGANRFESILSYVHHHIYEETISAAEVAEHFGISLSALSREFQKHTGSGFLNYIQTKRIATAKNMLRQSRKSVKEIAQEVGYTNSLSFTRAFRKYEGVTPGAYRSAKDNRTDQATTR